MATGLTANLSDKLETGVSESQADARAEDLVQGGRSQIAYRTKELEWRRTHGEDLQTFAGEWIVLKGEEIVAHGSDPVQIATEARARRIRVPYIFYVEVLDEGVVRIGL